MLKTWVLGIRVDGEVLKTEGVEGTKREELSIKKREEDCRMALVLCSIVFV